MGTGPRPGPPGACPRPPAEGQQASLPFVCLLPQRVRAPMRVRPRSHSPDGVGRGGWTPMAFAVPLPVWLPDLPVQLGKPDRPWVRTRGYI